jgi:Tfp pilus assembly protein PilW
MDFNTTSIKPKKSAGMALVELMIAAAIASILSAALASLAFYTGRSFAAMAHYVDLDHKSRNALDRLSKEIRQTNRLTDFSPTKLTFEDFDGSELIYLYDPDAQTLTRIYNGVADPKPLLEQCTSLQFSIFQRNPIMGAYNQYPTASAETAKLVQLHWVCQRITMGSIINTESVQSAKIVIRKQ